MRGKAILLAGICTTAVAFPAHAQEADNANENEIDENVIVVTAQRQAQSLPPRPAKSVRKATGMHVLR